MFFIMGINEGVKKLLYNGRLVLCKTCGQYFEGEILMSYMAFSLFFIPLFKWNKRYFVKAPCCGSVFFISKEKGRRIEMGKDTNILEEDIISVVRTTQYKKCPECGKEVDLEFKFCPECGRKF